MPSKRRYDQRTRAFNERHIKRKYDNWGNGEVKDIEDPRKAFSELVNAKDFQTEVRGRTGSILYNPAKWGLNIPSDLSLEDALDSGGILYGYESEELIIIYDWGDFSGGDFETAKKNALDYKSWWALLFPYDIFKIDFVEGVIVPVYVGNLLFPFFDGYVPNITGDGDGAERYFFNVEKIGNQITILDGSIKDFPSGLKNYYILYGRREGESTFYGQRDLVIDSSSTTLTSSSTNYEGRYERCMIQAPIWASIYHQTRKKLIFQIGKEIYETNIPIDGYKKIRKMSNVDLSENSEAIFNLVDEEIILTNQNGTFRITWKNDNNDPYIWRINSSFEEYRVEPVKRYYFGFPTSTGSDGSEDDNPFSPKGFSARTKTKEPDKTGGQWL